MVVVLRQVMVRVNGSRHWERGVLLAVSEGLATVTTPAATRQYAPGQWKEVNGD